MEKYIRIIFQIHKKCLKHLIDLVKKFENEEENIFFEAACLDRKQQNRL